MNGSVFRRTMSRNGLVLRHNSAIRQACVMSHIAPEQNQQLARSSGAIRPQYSKIVRRHRVAFHQEKFQMLLNYYIYYRIAPSAAARARAVVDAVQSALGQETGIHGRLLRRDDDASTWMEIYEGVTDPPRFEAALERLLAQYGFDGCMASDARRHTERFTLF